MLVTLSVFSLISALLSTSFDDLRRVFMPVLEVAGAGVLNVP
jgi:hypothetical protein